MHLHSFVRVLGTTGHEAAARGQQRREHDLIPANSQQEQAPHGSAPDRLRGVPHTAREVRRERRHIGGGSVRACGDHHLEPRRQVRVLGATQCAETPLHPVPRHGVSDFLTDGDPDARVRAFDPPGGEHQERTVDPAAGFIDRGILGWASEAGGLGPPQAGIVHLDTTAARPAPPPAWLVGRQALAAVAAARPEDGAAGGRFHAMAKSMLTTTPQA